MIPGKSTTIEDMKLLNPVQVIKPNKNDGYYYDGKIYGDLDLLKRKQLNDILVGRYYNKKLKKIHSLVDLENNNNPRKEFCGYSINELSSNFSNHVNNVLNKPNFVEDEIIKKSSMKFDSIIYDKTDTLKGNVDKILNDIKPTLVTQTPILNPYGHKLSGTPIYKDGTDYEDDSLKEYKLPGKSWTSNGGFNINNDNNFIIADQNATNQNTSIDSKIKLQNEFYNSFNVDSREVDINLLKNISLFSDLSKKIEGSYCYFAVGKDNETNIFLNKNDAIKWLMSEFDFKTYYKKEKAENFFIDNLAFDNYNDYLDWIRLNVREEE